MANAGKTVQFVADAGTITLRCGDVMISEPPHPAREWQLDSGGRFTEAANTL